MFKVVSFSNDETFRRVKLWKITSAKYLYVKEVEEMKTKHIRVPMITSK